MSLRGKLAGIIAIVFSLILILHTSLYYYSTRDLLITEEANDMKRTSNLISGAIAHAEYGKKYVEDLIGENLRSASIAAQLALNPDYRQITTEQLQEISDMLNISHITLLAPANGDILGVRSSDPKELGMSTKDWGYWYTAFEQLLKDKTVTIPEGQKLRNYWSGPIEISSSDPTQLDKWGYYYDGSTNYIINPYVRDEHIQTFEQATGIDAIVREAMEHSTSTLEITGFNPKTFGLPPQVFKTAEGLEFVRYYDQAVLFGTYNQTDPKDVELVKQAFNTLTPVTYNTTVNGVPVIKSYYPIMAEHPYVLGIVNDLTPIDTLLQKQLYRNLLIAVGLFLLAMIVSYLIAGSLVRPIRFISRQVMEIAKGNFDARVQMKREDELGQLADHVNVMTRDLQVYTQELLESKEQIKHQAYHDALTGLPNRRFLREKFGFLSDSDHTGETFALLLFDLDRFKMINDTLGHHLGDQLLCEIAVRIRQELGEELIVSRIGGDEFTIILAYDHIEEIGTAASRIIELVVKPFHVLGKEIMTGVSIGISLYPRDGQDFETLFRQADIAMFQAKQNGGNQYLLFNDEMRFFNSERMELENLLRRALEKEEIYVVYQPKVDSDGMMVGMEALVRWNSQEKGNVTPDRFIPIAEETGLILEIGEKVLRDACSQNREWQRMGLPPVIVSVNLSARQFKSRSLVQKIRDILYETGLEPRWLELELTESILMDNMEEILLILHELRAMGIRIAIDDFGTGYSSMSYLTRLPIDTLKIDRSFVKDIGNNDVAEVSSAIISLGHTLNLTVVAEGVETEEQLELLKARRCDEMQGYYFSRPLTADRLEDYLRRQAERMQLPGEPG